MFVVVLIPSLHIPMQSDDYAYYSLGLSLDAQLIHYLGWSGRIVTNIISSYLLNLFPHYGYEIVNSFVFALLIAFIFLIPKAVDGKGLKGAALSLLLIFTLYWVSNPSLGETSFWIVGSANYLWPSMFVAGYFSFLFYCQNRKTETRDLFFGLVLGFLAGCSNENTSVIVVLITLFVAFAENNRTLSLFAIVGNLIGAGVLILSPGNGIRAKVFSDWRSLSLNEKFDLHFFERFPSIVSGYWQVYLVLIVSLFAIAVISKADKKQMLYAFVFFIGAFLASAAFIASPFIPARAGNGALVFLLISFSFLINVILQSDLKRLKVMYASCVILFLGVYFVPSYYLFNIAVGEVWAQSKVRESMLFEAKVNGLKEATIPSYYYTKLLKDSDKLSSFDNSSADGYYGLERITYVPATFNYANIQSLPKLNVNLLINDGVKISSIYSYEEGGGYKSKLLFEVVGDINETFNQGAFLYVHVFMKDGTYFNRDTGAAALTIGKSSYVLADLGVDHHKIERIELGMYKTNEMLSSFVIKEPSFSIEVE
jgi:hypothetical protein